jgi:tricorn protease
MHRAAALAVALASLAAQPLGAQIDARMFRYPDVSATHITFVYAGDIWIVPKSGGMAHRLSSPPGEETFPRFSPDGSRIAFSANYDGNTDIYVVPTMGGEPVRVTHHPMGDRMLDWYPEGDALLFASARESGRQRFRQFYRVWDGGGLPEKLPLPYGEFGTLSPDGTTLAYTPKSRDSRTWKRYRGGWATDVWLFDLETLESRNITNDPANDGQPMWYGRTLYFLSDRGERQRHNIWALDLDTDNVRQVTRFTDVDVTFPAAGPSDIVFQAGGLLYLLDLASESLSEVSVEVVTDQTTLRPRMEKAAALIFNGGISPSGQRAVFEARGDVFTVPAEHGPVRNITASSGVAERYPAWSPDGQWVAYWSDRSGEYQLTVRAADGSGEERVLTEYGPGYRYRPHWSPDSEKLAFVDQTMTIRIYDMEQDRTTDVDQALFWYQGALNWFRPSWSADSRWLAYHRDLENRNSGVFLFDTRSGQVHQVTAGYYSDAMPVFDPDGNYLYFLTNRNLQPVYSDFDNTWVYPNATNIAAASLRLDVPSPLAPRSDEEEPDGEAEGEDDGDDNGSVQIDLADFERRVTVLPPDAGNYNDLRAVSGKVLFRRLPRSGSGGEQSPIVYWDLEEREEKTVIGDADGYELSADGKKLLVRDDRRFAIIDLKPGQKIEKPLRTAEMEAPVDPRAEWRQIFADAWRLERDFFYDPNMHGVDWNAARQHYGRLLEDAVTRWDRRDDRRVERIAHVQGRRRYGIRGSTRRGPPGCGLVARERSLPHRTHHRWRTVGRGGALTPERAGSGGERRGLRARG